MQIDNLIINADAVDIIKALREQSTKPIFAKYFDSGDDVMVCCPYHKDGQERRPSAGIRKSDGLFHCLACGETHSLPEVVAYCLGYRNPLQGHKWLAQRFASAEVKNRESIEVRFKRNAVSNKSPILDNCGSNQFVYISDGELDTYRYTHSYMYERGLTDEVIELFDIGYDKKTDSITFPVKDLSSNCLFVARRSVKFKRFDIPKSVDKPLYGLSEVYHNICDKSVKVYVCEGLFDCLRMWCNGKLAVAGFGCLFSDRQIKQLNLLPVRTIVLALDADKAGRQATARLRKAIKNKIVKEVVLPVGRKDIGECTDEEIQNLKEVL